MVSQDVKSANDQSADVFITRSDLIELAQNDRTTPFDYVIVGSGLGEVLLPQDSRWRANVF